MKRRPREISEETLRDRGISQLKLNKEEWTDEQKAKVKVKHSNRNQFFMRWNLTKESITDNFGFKSMKVMHKVIKLLDMKLVQFLYSEHISESIQRDVYACLPVKGYNKTIYTMHLERNQSSVTLRCNCQYASSGRLCAHLMALRLKEGLYKEGGSGNIRYEGGVRKVSKSMNCSTCKIALEKDGEESWHCTSCGKLYMNSEKVALGIDGKEDEEGEAE